MRHILLSFFLLAFYSLTSNADPVEIDGIYYNLVSKAKTAEIVKNPDYYSGTIVIPSSVTYEEVEYCVESIGEYAFLNCKGLASVTIPNSVISMGDGAFAGCNSLTSMIIPNSVTSIGNDAFNGCGNLSSVLIGSSVASIGECAFIGCGGLTSITIPNSVTSIGREAFFDCPGLTTVTIGNSVISIGYGAFQGCSGLADVTIGESVRTIGNCVFRGCSGLTSVIIPNSVTNIGSEAFYGCVSLTTISIPNSVTSISNGTFSGCTGLTSITIPNTVTSIGSEAFAKCNNLIEVYCWAENVPITKADAFKDSYPELITLQVPEKSIDTYKSTEPWSKFKEIVDLDTTNPETPPVIINNPVEIDGIYYNLVSKAKTAEIVKNPDYYSGTIVIPSSVTYEEVEYCVESIGEYAFLNCKGLASVTIPNSVISMGDGAFAGCNSLTSMIIPNSVTSIGNDAFNGCGNLSSVLIGSSVASIGECAFIGCGGLTSITIPNSVTSIGREAFFDCPGLTTVTIGNSVISIGYGAFQGCSGLADVTIGESVRTIGNCVFRGCSGLTSVIIPNSVTNIGSEAFYGCVSLTTISIPNSVTSISNGTFSGCTGLTSITIPNTVTSIGSEAFAKCNNLIEVYCWAENVPITKADAFKDSYPEYINLHVPGKSIDAYKVKEPWSKFKELFALDGTALAKINIGSQGQGTYCFDQDLDFSDVSGIEVYVACGFNPANSQILLMKVQDAPAGTGLYVKTTSGKAGEFSIPVKNSYSYYMNMLKPVFASTTVPTVEDDYTNYVLTNGTFSKSNGTSKLEANSAYLQFPNKLLSSSDQILSVSFVDVKLPGDVNNDGRVNVADIVALNNLIKSPAGSYSSAADLNNDGKVNDVDISILVQMIMGR